MNSNYFIKPGYITNEINQTWEESPQEYWTDERLKSSLLYQYYVYQTVAILFKEHQMKRLMDVGCGPATKIKHFFTSLTNDITLIDQPTVEPLIRQQLDDFEFISTDLGTIELELDVKQDMIICADVVEHLMNPDSCMKFIYSSLQSDGIAIFSTPERDFLRGKDSNQCQKPSHVREWNSTEFASYLKSHGFTIIQHDWFPQARIQSTLFQISRQIPNKLWQNIPLLARRLGGCQMVICTL